MFWRPFYAPVILKGKEVNQKVQNNIHDLLASLFNLRCTDLSGPFCQVCHLIWIPCFEKNIVLPLSLAKQEQMPTVTVSSHWRTCINHIHFYMPPVVVSELWVHFCFVNVFMHPLSTQRTWVLIIAQIILNHTVCSRVLCMCAPLWEASYPAQRSFDQPKATQNE